MYRTGIGIECPNLIGLAETIQTHTRCGIENSKCDRKNNIFFSFDRAYGGQTESDRAVYLDRDPALTVGLAVGLTVGAHVCDADGEGVSVGASVGAEEG